MVSKNIETRGNGGEQGLAGWHPLESLHDEVERIFNRYMPTRFVPPFFETSLKGNFAQMDVSESAEALDIMVDVPGMTERQVEVTLSDGLLTIRGERRSEAEERKKDFHRVERSYGAFQRRFSLPCEVDEKAVTASVHNGVLAIHLPKSAKAKASERKIPVKAT
ncbi:MAG: Hsp20/alpha crystallin family protein [Pseudomonadota bacterium]